MSHSAIPLFTVDYLCIGRSSNLQKEDYENKGDYENKEIVRLKGSGFLEALSY
jgi:hypothetical protein